MKYRCYKCNYSFESERKVCKCPYCGDDKVSKEKDAEELIDEVS